MYNGIGGSGFPVTFGIYISYKNHKLTGVTFSPCKSHNRLHLLYILLFSFIIDNLHNNLRYCKMSKE
jgi:hypothetical protein